MKSKRKNKKENMEFLTFSPKTGQKKAAMEMSIGTIVTIVLFMIILVLGIFFIQRIFSTGTNAIDQIDAKIQNEIDKLFAEEGKRIAVYPKEREIRMKKGDSGGFGFSITNKDFDDGVFSYEVKASEIASGCQLTLQQADELIKLGKSNLVPINLGSGDKLEDAILVRFQIPETAPLCLIRYQINVKKTSDSTTTSYAFAEVDLKII